MTGGFPSQRVCGARFGVIGLGLQGLYSATNCADNILGRFTIILQNQIARVDSFTNLTKRWVFRFRLNASISSHNLISFGKQFYARGPYTANARLPKVSCLNFGTFRTRSSLDLMEYLLLFDMKMRKKELSLMLTETNGWINSCQWFKTSLRPCDVTVMYAYVYINSNWHLIYKELLYSIHNSPLSIPSSQWRHMSVMASHITENSTVCSEACSD